jgi:Tol biopolymer transport system component
MKKIVLLCLLSGISSLLIAQPNTTEIWLLDMVQKEGKTFAMNPYRMTENDHYDNQPCFSKDGQFLYYASMPDTSQSDIYEFHIRKKQIRQITNSPESEYQPQLIPYAKGKLSIVRVEMEKTQKLYEVNLDGSEFDYLMPNEDSVAYYTWMNDTTVGAYMLNGKGGMLQQFDMVPQQAIILMEGGFGRCLSTIPGTNLMTYVQKGSDGTNTLMKYDMSNEERMPILDFPKGVEDYCWGPGEKVYCSDKGILYMYDTKNEDGQWVSIGDFSETIGNFYRMAMSQAGDKIAIVSYKGDKP